MIRKLKFVLICFLSLIIYQKVQGQNPNWVVNPRSFDYQMQFTASLKIDGIALTNTNDQVAVFVGNELRGVGNITFNSTNQKYVSFFSAYANTIGETLSFKIYDSTQNTVFDAVQTQQFIINEQVGGIFQSFVISNTTLGTEADIINFGFQGVTAISNSKSGNNFNIVLPSGTAINSLTPTFSLSNGANAFINFVKQNSNTNSRDFTNPVTYQVLSEDEKVLEDFTINVSVAASSSNPTVALSSAENTITNNKQFQITIDFSEEISGLTDTDFQTTNAVVSNISAINSTRYTATITLVNNGNATIKLLANSVNNNDTRGNLESNTLSYTYDNVTPLLEIQEHFLEQNYFQITFTENVTNVSLDDFSLSGSLASNYTLNTLQQTSNAIYTISYTGNTSESGSLYLEINNNSDITDIATNNLSVQNIEVYYLNNSTFPLFENDTPKITEIKETSFTLQTDIDIAGTIYYVILANNATAPTAIDVKNGTGSSGASVIASDSAIANSGDFSNTFTVTSLTKGTAYDIYVVAEDNEPTPNLQTNPSLVEVTLPTKSLPNGIIMKNIDGDTFTLGSNDLIGSPDQKIAAPEYQVTLSSYAMSEAEITNAQYVMFLNAALSDGLIEIVTGSTGPDKDKELVVGSSNSSYNGEVLYTLDGTRVLKDHGNEDGDNNEFTGTVEPENPLNISYIGFNSSTQTFYVKDPFNVEDFHWINICDYQDYGTTPKIFEGAILNDFNDWAGTGANYSNELQGWTENNTAGATNLPTQTEVAAWPVTFIRWRGAKAFADYYHVSLPTEAQWEYAAKGGSNFEYAVYDGQSVNDANWNTAGINSLATGHVRTAISGNANPFGLYNLAGNVWEWMADNYVAPYDTSIVTNPLIEENGSTLRSWRGGAWNYHEATLQSSIRFFDEENRGNDHFGFRIAGTHSATDAIVPVLHNLSLKNTALSNATSITYTAVFSEAVNLVSADDFVLTKTGSANGFIGTPTTTDNITWEIIINTITGDGTLRLDLKEATDIQDFAGNSNPVSKLGDDIHTSDFTDPTFDSASSIPNHNGNNFSASANIVMVFSEDIVLGTNKIVIREVSTNATIESFDVAINNTGGTNPNPGEIGISGRFLYINPTLDLIADGRAYAIRMNPNAIDDLNGNSFAGMSNNTFYSFSTIVDTTAPVLNSLTIKDSPESNATTINYTAFFNETVSQVSADDFTITKTNTVNATIGTPTTIDGITWLIPITDISGEGTIRLDLKEGTNIEDTTTNSGVSGKIGDDSHTIDTVLPILSTPNLIPNDDAIGVLTTNNVSIEFSEHITLHTGTIRIIDVTNGNNNFQVFNVANAVEGNNPNDGEVHFSENSIYINPTENFEESTQYAIQIDASTVSDLNENSFLGISDFSTFNFTTGDFTAPVFENNTPTITSINGNSITLETDINESGTIYYVVLSDGETAPSALEIKNGFGNNGETAEKSGTISVNSQNFTNQFTINELISEKKYDIYLVAEDDEDLPNLQPNPTFLEATTLDVSVPIVNSITLENTPLGNQESITYKVVFNEIVSLVSSDDFKLTKIDTANGVVGTPTTSDNINWFIIISNVSGNGALRLDLNEATDIQDEASNTGVLSKIGDDVHTVDFINPTFIGNDSSPKHNGSNFNASENIVMAFSEDITLGTNRVVIREVATNATIESFDVAINNTGGANPNPGEVGISGRFLYINPTEALIADGREYAIRMNPNSVDDLNGNSFAGMSNNSFYKFSTENDTTNPTIDGSNSDPLDNATNVGLSENIVIDFTENIKIKLGNNGIIRLREIDEDTSVSTFYDSDYEESTTNPSSGRFSIVDDKLYLNPDINLKANTNYSVRVIRFIEDIIGNDMVDTFNDTDYNFKTTLLTWNGNTNSDWNTATNWNTGQTPTLTDDIIIPNVTNAPNIGSNTNALAKNVLIENATQIIISNGGSLTVDGDLTNNGNSLTINSGSSLIVNGTASGNITYIRNLPTSNWYSITSPVIEQNIDVFVANSNLASGQGNNIALGSYQNTSNTWSYYQNGSTSSGSFSSGKGYIVKLANPGHIEFTGTMPTNDFSDISLTDNSLNSGSAFNFIGNPYPSFISANTLLSTNDSGDNDLLKESTIWVWNESKNNYDTYNFTSDFQIAPTQGFFVKTDGNANTFAIKETMQSHQYETFQKSGRPEINLEITNGTTNRDTKILYINGTTTGFDNGYDSNIFEGTSNNLLLYSALVTDGNGEKLAIQSLPNSNFDQMVIPIGLVSNTGTITFKVDKKNIPEGYNVYLEDRETSSFIDFSEDNTEHEVILTNAIDGLGRFYLHLKLPAVTWNGNMDTHWSNPSNWNTNAIPTETDDVIIPDVTNKPIIDISTNAVAKDLYIESLSTLNITGGGSLTISGKLNNNGESITIGSGASLIVKGTSTGNITYVRNLSTTNWYSITSPVIGQDIDAFVSNANLASGQGNNIALGSYLNSNNSWNYYQNGSNNSGNFLSGKGYTIKRNAIGNIEFTGTMPTTDFSDINLTDNSLNSGSAFNLVGNPYPSFISTNTLLNTNDILKEATIWIWNQNTDNYDTYNLATDFFIAPTQSFFVKTDGNKNSFSITENMQSHQLETFQKSKKLQIQLQVSNSNSNRNTSIYYIKNTTINFDNGYDSNIFEGITNEFNVYTGLVSNTSTEKLGIQSLPKTNFEEMIVPIGLISKAGTITFSVKKQYLPNEYTIYLEDRLTNNIVNLSQQNNTYSINLDKSVHGIGRFYLHTKSNSLDINTLNLASIRVYLLNKNTLSIEGIQSGKTQIKIFDILGKIIFENTLQSNGIDAIKLPSLSNGTYILKINSNLGVFHQKILIH